MKYNQFVESLSVNSGKTIIIFSNKLIAKHYFDNCLRSTMNEKLIDKTLSYEYSMCRNTSQERDSLFRYLCIEIEDINKIIKGVNEDE